MKSTINNAQYNYLSAIAKVLGCKVEDLLEYGQAVESYIDSRAPLKTPLLRLGWIFCSNNSFRKVRNTQSIPDFPKLLLNQNLSPKSSKKSF